MSGIIKQKGLTIKKLLNLNYTCKICEKKFTNSTYLCNHLKTHNILIKDYLLKYFNINIDEINKEWLLTKNERKIKQLSGLYTYINSIKGKNIKERLGENGYNKFKHSMEGVFSKSWYIKKYGKNIGETKYNDRILNLSNKTYWNRYNKQNKQNWSNISQDLFNEIYKIIKYDYDDIYYGSLNHEYGCETNKNFDFVIKDIKKVIEFNGDKFHANPRIYESKDIPLKFIGLTSKDIWKNDKEKIESAINNGYDVLIIWESDFLKNKEKIILKCIDFIKNVKYEKNSKRKN